MTARHLSQRALLVLILSLYNINYSGQFQQYSKFYFWSNVYVDVLV